MKIKHSYIATAIITVAVAAILLFSKPLTQKYSTTLAPQSNYGVMTDDTTMNLKLFGIQSLGLDATRESILTSTYKGTAGRLQFWNTNGIKMFLNINSYQQSTGKGFQSPDTFVPIMLDIANKYKPYWIFIENEELNNSYHEGDLFNDYTKLIKAVIDSGHAHGLKISNGGITSRKMVGLTYRWLAQTNNLSAAYFLANCVPVDDTAWLSNYMSNPKKEQELALNERLLNIYDVIDLDAVNVHLYLPFKNRTKGVASAKGSGIAGLNYVLDYIHSICPSKQIISNEVGFVENNTDLSYSTFKALDSASVEVCFYGGNGSKRFMRDGNLTKLGTGIKNYKP